MDLLLLQARHGAQKQDPGIAPALPCELRIIENVVRMPKIVNQKAVPFVGQDPFDRS